MKSRPANVSGSITGIEMHLTTGATSPQINPTVEVITIDGVTVKVGSLSHKRLLAN